MRISTKIIAVVGAASITVATAGVAYAYWTSTGSGTGTASTSAGDAGTNAFLTVTQNTTLNAMYPGDASQMFSAKVKNVSTDNSNVYVSSVKAYLTTNQVGCDGTDYKLDGVATAVDAASAVPLAWTSADLAHNGTQDTDGTDTIQFNNKAASSQNACKGATVTIHYLAS